MSLQLKYKRLKYEIKFLTSTIEEIQEEMRHALPEFENAFKEKVPEYQHERKKEDKVINEHKTENELKSEEIRKEPSRDVKKVYRKICSKTHPDKLEKLPNTTIKKRLIKDFKKAVESYNSDDIVGLFDIADELDIKLPEIDESHIASMEQKIQKLNSNIESYRKSNALIWYKSEDKDGVMQQIIDSLKQAGRI